MASRKIWLVFALVLSFTSVASYQTEASASVAVLARDQEVEFVYDAYDNLEKYYFNPLAIQPQKLFNAALDGAANKLKEYGVNFIPQKIPEYGNLSEVYTIFPQEMAKAKRLAVAIRDFNVRELAFAATAALLAAVDDSHCYFIRPEFNRWFGPSLYVGTGIVLARLEKDFWYISRAVKNGPADKAGVRRFDRLAAIDGRPISDNHSEIVSQLRGVKGSEVEITVERKKTLLKIKITRDNISDESVESAVVSESGRTYTYIKINGFEFDSAYYFQKYIGEGEKKNSQGIILDLRGNPGGLIMALNNILNQLLPKGTPFYILKDTSGLETVKSIGSGSVKKPLVVLVDEYSYSASEMTTSALKEAGRARIVGKKSGGKVGAGMTYPLTYGAAMMVTVAEVFSAKMRPLEKTGVEPDVSVELTKENILAGEDSQLTAALKELWKMLEK